MKLDRKLRLQLLVHHGVFVVLLVAAVGLLAKLAMEYRVQWDITRSARNSVSQASRDVLAQMRGPITVTAFATTRDTRLGEIRKLIRDFIAPFQAVKPDMKLVFVNPDEQPGLAREAGVEANGEMIVEFDGRREHLKSLSEQAFANLLMRLARRQERLVMYLDGHGERKLDGSANHDLGELGRQLRNKGFAVSALNLAQAPDIPRNLSLLVISQPRVELLPGEAQRLVRYLREGGKLLWLVDPEPLRGLEPLAEELGLTLSPGTVVDPTAARLSAPPTFAIGTSYARHPVTENFSLITVFPFARALSFAEKTDWKVTPLVEAAPGGWVESGDLDAQLAFDEGQDTPGPALVLATLTRTVKDEEQRVAVAGSGGFLANAYLGNAGNLDFGVNLVNWLAGDERLVTIQPRAAADAGLQLDRTTLIVMVIAFLVALPLVFLGTGVALWWRRRQA